MYIHIYIYGERERERFISCISESFVHLGLVIFYRLLLVRLAGLRWDNLYAENTTTYEKSSPRYNCIYIYIYIHIIHTLPLHNLVLEISKYGGKANGVHRNMHVCISAAFYNVYLKICQTVLFCCPHLPPHGPETRLRPTSVLRFWIPEGPTQADCLSLRGGILMSIRNCLRWGFCHISWAALLVWSYLSNTASFVLCVFRRVKDHRHLLHYSPRLKKACVRQVVLDKLLPLSHIRREGVMLEDRGTEKTTDERVPDGTEWRQEGEGETRCIWMLLFTQSDTRSKAIHPGE